MKALLLIGGGHAHVTALRWLKQNPQPHLKISLLTPDYRSVYSGMVPGFVAGHFARKDVEIDLAGLCRDTGTAFIEDAASYLDVQQQYVTTAKGINIPYDLASIDVGIVSHPLAAPPIPDSIAAKPMACFLDSWETVRSAMHAPNIAIIGAGLGGVELALSVRHAMSSRFRAETKSVSLIERNTEILAQAAPSLGRQLRKKLVEAGIDLFEGTEPTAWQDNALQLSDGRSLKADHVFWVAGAAPYDWLSRSGLETEEGFPLTQASLQSVSHPNVFIAGDTARFADKPISRAGVYAVRQGPVLIRNLAAQAKGDPLENYNPQKDYMKLVTLGSRKALVEKWGITLSLPGLWVLKRRIDEAFVRG
ncbi:FAD-dependent oxidoreductase [Hyphomonas pacifica]|uniref:FAD/NAD(P)-binding domain-containing protein n=1 Tax=Hyphomonas pacifica TaxID=1280941 RepID=A0A062TS85_9PROT|nr:FAD-dependent oxidoreductase [Hyphomonas pacifica]KCZ50671.1 hypothetical protein HY2_02125 [Hyphomonas pacifica]RAN30949.1 hypothetical protein HY3_04950 [Hyphomonas pacifica]